jgi:hypothetical protein
MAGGDGHEKHKNQPGCGHGFIAPFFNSFIRENPCDPWSMTAEFRLSRNRSNSQLPIANDKLPNRER